MHTREIDRGRLDQSRLYGIYKDWPKYFEDALKFSDVPDKGHHHYRSVVLCGMGGSATSNDILQELMNMFGTVPCLTLRGQGMPPYVDESSLVIINSVSGDTSEALLMLKCALKHNAEIRCISSGGQLEREAYKTGCKHIKIPNLSVPRASLPYTLIPGLTLIDPFLRATLKDDLRMIPGNVAKTLRGIMADVPEEHNVAKKIASFVLDGFPFCYASPPLLPTATRFKNSMNENAKLHCNRESILEASHNDIVPFTYSSMLAAPKILHVRWKYDSLLVKNRFDKVHSLFDKVVHEVMEIVIPERSLLVAILSAIYILDISTIYVAIAKNTDPSPTPAIQILKDL